MFAQILEWYAQGEVSEFQTDVADHFVAVLHHRVEGFTAPVFETDINAVGQGVGLVFHICALGQGAKMFKGRVGCLYFAGNFVKLQP